MAGGYPVPFIKFREDTADGFPLAGGKLFSYAAGTSTPLATYFDQDLAVGHENQNPTILDASGRANVWVAAGVAYKFVLKDALDNTIWTQDNVQVPLATTGGGGGPAPTVDPFPVGGIVPYAGSVAPTGWLLCDGAGVSRTTYNALFNVCGETYGPGNGSTTFNLPNLTQRFPLGKALGGVGATLGSTGGQIDHRHTGPSHTHGLSAVSVPSAGAHTHATDVSVGEQGGVQYGSGFTVATVNHTHNISLSGAHTHPSVTGSTDAGGTQDTGTGNPPFLTLNFIIRT